jgi:hypothetical protein
MPDGEFEDYLVHLDRHEDFDDAPLPIQLPSSTTAPGNWSSRTFT